MSDKHTTVQYQLRLPEELRNTIRQSAKNHNRSMNADIVARLEASFTEEEQRQDVVMNVVFDDRWFDETGLSREEFGAFVRMAVQSNVAQYKVDKD